MPSENLFAQVQHGSSLYERCIDLRRRVLLVPLGLDFTDEQIQQESADLHFALVRDQIPVAACVATKINDFTAQIRQVAVEPAEHGKGLGAQLMRQTAAFLYAEGYREAIVHARANVVPFYLKLGYYPYDSEFIEVGIPHRKMRLQLPGHPGRPDPTYYAESFPADFGSSLAVLPVGALEWHGSHLPMGTDNFLVESFAYELARRLNGKLLPTLWTPITPLPHQLGIGIRTDSFRMLVEDVLAALVKNGFSRIALITGHYAQGHLWELYDIADAAMAANSDLLAVAGSPLEPLAMPDLLDHAGSWETAQLMFGKGPGFVRNGTLPPVLEPKRDAVLGDDPRHADIVKTAEYLELAQARWAELLSGNQEAARAFHAGERAELQGYRDRFYKESWQQAIESWWATK
ncbi:MAG: GNAT family N-acetyltransferase [Armatimonadetes bacterium]|nr:GNAT family N-acetyltransferase [Armatimonadota bacterium]